MVELPHTVGTVTYSDNVQKTNFTPISNFGRVVPRQKSLKRLVMISRAMKSGDRLRFLFQNLK